MIDIHQFRPETLLVAGLIAGLLIGATIGAIAIGLAAGRRIRKARLAGFREVERLLHTRAIEDRRDNTRLF